MNGFEIFVGVYGSLRLHPWVATEVESEIFELEGVTREETYRGFRVSSAPGPLADDPDSADAFGAFLSRAEAMMWLPDEAPAGGLWGMNDANVVWSPGDSSGLIAWFQVGPNISLNPPRLPIQPLVAVAEHTLRRFGKLTVTGTQLLLPTQLANGQKHLDFVPSPFILCDPDASVPLRVLSMRGPTTTPTAKPPTSSPCCTV